MRNLLEAPALICTLKATLAVRVLSTWVPHASSLASSGFRIVGPQALLVVPCKELMIPAYQAIIALIVVRASCTIISSACCTFAIITLARATLLILLAFFIVIYAALNAFAVVAADIMSAAVFVAAALVADAFIVLAIPGLAAVATDASLSIIGERY